MTIHHATVKRAASMGVVLTSEDDVAVAHHTERNKRIVNEDAKAALFFVLVAAKLAVEYPQVEITNEGDAEVDGDVVYTLDPEGDVEEEASAVIDALVADDDEEPSGAVVVAQRYKDEYKARGDASGCGDWLHRTLKRYTIETEGKPVFDHEGFTMMLEANGVVVKGKFADMPHTAKKGWEGRYRMNGRQMLEGKLLRAGGLLQLDAGKPLQMPSEDYDDLLNLKRHRSLKEAMETEAEEAAVAAKKAKRTKK